MSLFKEMRIGIEQPPKPIETALPSPDEVAEKAVTVFVDPDMDGGRDRDPDGRSGTLPQFEIVRAAYAAMEEAYFQMPCRSPGRKIFKAFLARSTKLKRLDAAIDERLVVLGSGNATPEARSVAMQQLREGMDYWLRLCLKKIQELNR